MALVAFSLDTPSSELRERKIPGGHPAALSDCFGGNQDAEFERRGRRRKLALYEVDQVKIRDLESEERLHGLRPGFFRSNN